MQCEPLQKHGHQRLFNAYAVVDAHHERIQRLTVAFLGSSIYSNYAQNFRIFQIKRFAFATVILLYLFFKNGKYEMMIDGK